MLIIPIRGVAFALAVAALAGGVAVADSATVPELDTTQNDYFWTTTNHVNSTVCYAALSGVVVTGTVDRAAASATVGSAAVPFVAIATTQADGALHKAFSTLPVSMLIDFR